MRSFFRIVVESPCLLLLCFIISCTSEPTLPPGHASKKWTVSWQSGQVAPETSESGGPTENLKTDNVVKMSAPFWSVSKDEPSLNQPGKFIPLKNTQPRSLDTPLSVPKSGMPKPFVTAEKIGRPPPSGRRSDRLSGDAPSSADVTARPVGKFEFTTISGRAKIIDGDTLEIGGELIQLLGVDAPEINQFCKSETNDYPCGVKAMSWLVERVRDKKIRCEGDHRNAQNQLLALCYLNKHNLNAELVRAGWAYVTDITVENLAAALKSAKKNQRGLWQGEAIPPWQWRASQ